MKSTSLAVIAVLTVLVLASPMCADGDAAPTADLPGSMPAQLTANEGPRKAGEQAAPTSMVPWSGRWAGSPAKYFAGAFVGLLGHEGGHYIANVSLGIAPFAKPVRYGPFPWFTIEPNRLETRHEHYITASAGFTGQNLVYEWLLTKHPNLREENVPFLKGMATFDFWLGIGYAATAFAGTGPAERDTKGMADALGWNERWVGAMILAPTLLDNYRYNHPDSKWARWTSRLAKLCIIGLAAKAHD